MSILKATSNFTPRDDMGRFVEQRYSAKVKAAVEESAKIVLLEAQAIVPVDTGELRDSGHVETRRTEKGYTGFVIFDAAHAGFVEYGTGARGAASAGRGPYPYKLSWPGMVAQPYLRPALDTARAEMLGQFALRLRT